MSKGSKYIWLPGEPLPILDDHSKKKHEILKNYLREYLKIRIQSPHITDFPLVLVDGFSGGGSYTYEGNIVTGSPLIMMDTVKETEKEINALREMNKIRNKVKIHAEYYFVESNKKVYNCLSETLNQKSYNPSEYHLINGTFADNVQNIVQGIQKRKAKTGCIFLLDQYGYSAVNLNKIRYILQSIEKSEVILTFAVDWLIDFINNKDPKSAKILENIGFSDEIIKKLFKVHGDKENNAWKKNIQHVLLEGIIERVSAPYFTSFFVTSPKSHRSYWLLHLSSHSRARNAMTDIHWDSTNTMTHYGTWGLNMLGYKPDPHKDNLKLFSNEHYFGEKTRDITKDLLTEELPKLIYANNQIPEIKFSDICDKVCNFTPANKKIMKEALEPSLSCKDIEIISKKGRKRRTASAIEDDDMIKIPSQMRFFF